MKRSKRSALAAGFEIKNVQKAIGTSQDFLKLVEEKCGGAEKEWAERQKTRHEEIGSVAKAIEIQGSDEAQGSFGKTYSFLQRDDRLRRASEARSQSI